jgi:uncharacterized protein RhaS with RHS repeats
LSRYYEPVVGRYYQVDILGLFGGINTYRYSGNDAITYADPLGLMDPPSKVPDSLLGTCDYYLFRASDYYGRHGFPQNKKNECGKVDAQNNKDDLYYTNYGYKYCQRFQEEAKKLSPQGQKWVALTLKQLQIDLEDHLRQNKNIEDDKYRLKEIAFATHADAYIRSGIADLPVSDLIKIGMTPDAKDLMSLESVVQASKVGEAVGRRKLGF